MLLYWLLACSLVFVQGRPAAPSTHVLHQKRDFSTSRWTRRSRVSSSAILPMRIGLTQSDLDMGYDWLMDV